MQDTATNNVVPLNPTVVVEQPSKEKSSGLDARWGVRLSKPYHPVSRFFLQNYWRVKPHDGARGLNSSEAMLIIQILDHKWDDRAPFPSLPMLATRMGLSVRQLRATVKRLEDLGYLRRQPAENGGPNKYHFDGLINALHAMQDADVAAKDAADQKGAA